MKLPLSTDSPFRDLEMVEFTATLYKLFFNREEDHRPFLLLHGRFKLVLVPTLHTYGRQPKTIHPRERESIFFSY